MKLFRATNAHVLMVAFLIGLFATVMTGLQQTLTKAETTVGQSLALVVFLQNNLSDADASALQQTLKTQDSEITNITYVSREQAYQEAIKDASLAKSLALLKTNPLPPSMTVRYSDKAWWERSDPTEKLHGMANVQEIRWDPQALSVYRSLHRWRLWAMRFSAFGGMVLLVWAFIGLYRVLSLQSSAREVISQLTIGLFGGALAWGLWGMGVRSSQMELSSLHPAWVWLVPLSIGIVSALGCFGLEVRHAD